MSIEPKPYGTERIRRFRLGSPSENDEATLARIEQYGCEVVHVQASGVSPAWSYTVGVFDTCGKPELITIGLSARTGSSALNAAVAELRRGADLSEGRHRELVGEVECEFRPVHPIWVKHLMHSANWYNEGAEYPVLQAVYPDLKNRFPEDDSFDKVFQQPLLQSAELGPLEREFWEAMDPESRLAKWKFSDPPTRAAFLSQAVFNGSERITYVSHDEEDGAWQFLGESMSGDQPPVVSCLSHSIDNDQTLEELADLPLGWWAEREDAQHSWMRFQHPPSQA